MQPLVKLEKRKTLLGFSLHHHCWVRVKFRCTGGRKSAFVCEIMKRVHTFAGEIVKLCNFAFVRVCAVKLEVGLVDDDFPSKPSLQGPFEFSFQCGLDEAVDHDKASCLEDPMQWVKMYEYVYTRDFRANPEVCFGVCFFVWITILYSWVVGTIWSFTL